MPHPAKRALDEQTKKYDHSAHSTQRPEQGDLNSPGKTNEDGTIGPPSMTEAPGKAPKHRG